MVLAARCGVPRLPTLCHAGCTTGTLQSTVRASWAGEERHQERCDWWDGHIPAPSLPLPPRCRELCQAGCSPVPAHRHTAVRLATDARPGAGRTGNDVSSCWLPPSPEPLNLRHPLKWHLPDVFQEAVKDLPSVERRPCRQLAATSQQVGVGGGGQEPGSRELSSSESWSRNGCSTRQCRDWALSRASSGLSCRAGHRWETIAFCPGASRARAVQGG